MDGRPDKKPCIVCGRKPTHYPEHSARPVTIGVDDEVQPVPDHSRNYRCHSAGEMNRCLPSGDICDGDAIAWQDPGETCYSQFFESEVRA